MYEIHKRLNERCSPSKHILLGGKPILLCGDFYQPPPVQPKSLFKCDEAITPEAFVSVDFWLNFKLTELDQVMRQKDDTESC